jgi:RHS repeat-associated protein
MASPLKVYDPLGRRLQTIEKDGSGNITGMRRYAYDGFNVIGELYGSGALAASYTNGPGIDNPVSVRLYGVGGGDYYYHKNHQGSITAITDSSGNVAKQYNYDAFGKRIFESGPLLVDEPAYTARQIHDRTGLYYYRNRFYYPQLGRFISQDPIGIAAGTNLYSYVGNTPTGYNDPLGLWMEDIFDDPGERAGHMDQAIEMRQFIIRAEGRTLNELQHEADERPRSDRTAAGPRNEIRFVINPRNSEEVIDMRHMLVVGPQGEIIGLLGEMGQLFGDNDSAFDAQDFLSNAIGADFYEFLEENEYDPEDPLAPLLKEYFFGGPRP